MAYLRLLLLSATVSFGLVWAWVAAAPMAFMEPEYASWRAKQVMLDRCDLGDAIILGIPAPPPAFCPASCRSKPPTSPSAAARRSRRRPR